MKNIAQKRIRKQHFNVLTAKVEHPAIAKQIIEGILLDSGYAETTVDCLTMLCEAFASQENLLGVRDFATDLQHFLFTHTKESDQGVRDYIQKIRGGKDYDTEYLHLIAG